MKRQRLRIPIRIRRATTFAALGFTPPIPLIVALLVALLGTALVTALSTRNLTAAAGKLNVVTERPEQELKLVEHWRREVQSGTGSRPSPPDP